MKRWILMCAVAGLVVGCSSTPEKTDVPVTDAKPSTDVSKAPTKPPSDLTGKPATTGKDPGVNPLDDPKNILSRRSIFFDLDQFTVKEEFKPVVSAHANYLSQNRNTRMAIQGNTDDRGSREYNLALGQKRADAVKQMMTLLGASSAQIETVSFGEEKPRAQGSTEQAFSENRRADIVHQGE